MKICLLEMDLAWASPENNIAEAQRLIASQPSADLYVLPEMWATGFIVEPQSYIDDEGASLALQWMKSTACERKCAISGSLAIKLSEDNSYRNRHYFVTPDNVTFYDKHHLFTHGGENRHYVAGESAVIVSWQGVRFLLQTCYDLRFPVFSRWGRAGEYDAIIYVANWPASRQLAWDTLIRARAIENQCYVVAVNRTGSDPFTDYEGGSCLIDPTGKVVDEISMERLHKLRSHFQVLADRDLLIYNIDYDEGNDRKYCNGKESPKAPFC